MKQRSSTAIVGLGNVLLMDDGVGVQAIRKLMEDPPPEITLAEVGTAVLDALEIFEEKDYVVAIDAVQAGGSPGSTYTLDITDANTQRSLSLHEYGLSTALCYLPQATRPAVTILGVEPERIAYGMRLSPTVQAVLGQVMHTALSLAQTWTVRRTGVEI